MKKRWLSIFLLALLVFSGCEKITDESAKTEIVLIHNWGKRQEDHEIMRQIYDEFEAENPDIQLKQIAMPSTEKVVDKTQEMLAVGKVPDLIFLDGNEKDTVYTFMMEEGYALDIMPYIKKDSGFEKQMAPESLKNMETEKLYTISDTFSTGGYWYNQIIFDQAGITELPATWEEFIKCCEKIQQWAERKKWNTVPLYLNDRIKEYIVTAYTSGDKSEKALSESEDMIQVLQQFTDADRNENQSGGLRSFNAGHCAIYISDIRTEAELRENLKASFALLPSLDGQMVGMMSAKTGYIVGQTGNKKREEASIRFLKYMTSEKVQKRIFVETSQIPVNPNVEIKELERQCPKRLYDAVAAMEKAELFEELP